MPSLHIGSGDVVNNSLRSEDIRDDTIRSRDVRDRLCGPATSVGTASEAGSIKRVRARAVPRGC